MILNYNFKKEPMPIMLIILIPIMIQMGYGVVAMFVIRYIVKT